MPNRCLLAVAIAAVAWVAPALGEAPIDALKRGNPALGEPLAARDCVACHARRFDGDGDRMYLRAERKVRTPSQLMAQIRYCNAELGTGYFPDEEDSIGAYLNQRYYHFE
jgi:hypothetical protein